MTLSIINISKDQMQEFIESDAVEESFKRKMKEGLKSEEPIYKVKYEENGKIEIEKFKSIKKILKEYIDYESERLSYAKFILIILSITIITTVFFKFIVGTQATQSSVLFYEILFFLLSLLAVSYYMSCKTEYNKYMKIDKYINSTSHDYIEKNKEAMDFFS